MEALIRSEMLLGQAAQRRLAAAHVAVFGIGGVGGYAVEALVRSGVGTLSLFDHDVVSQSNLNRQIIALHSTVGQHKVEAMRARALDINPAVRVHPHPVFYGPENAAAIDLRAFDYVVDAVDTVTAKVLLAVGAREAGVSIVSCMGAGNKLDPTRFVVADLFETQGCPLARVMRRELRARGLDRLMVVYSREEPRKPLFVPEGEGRRAPPGSVAFVPPVAGLLAAGVVVRALAGV